MDKTDQTVHAPTLTLSFFVCNNVMPKFLNTFFPILFCTIAHTVSCITVQQDDTLQYVINVYTQDFSANPSMGGFLGTTVSIALTIVFLIPSIGVSSGRSISKDDVYIMSLYIALIVPFFGLPIFSMIIMWMSLLIPLHNWWSFHQNKVLLTFDPPAEASPLTFNGKPKMITYDHKVTQLPSAQ